MGRIANMVKSRELSFEEIGRADLAELMEQIENAEKLFREWRNIVLFPMNKDEILVCEGDLGGGDGPYYWYINKNGVLRYESYGDRKEYDLNTFKDCFKVFSDGFSGRQLKEYFISLLKNAGKF